MTRPNAYVGRPIERVEDLRMTRGRGTYVGDIKRPGQLHAVILRSSVAHGEIQSIDASEALRMRGVVDVLTATNFGDPVPRIPIRIQARPELEAFRQPVVADGKVRYVGEPIAVVIAETAAIAEDALERIDIQIAACPAVTGRQESNTAIVWTAALGDADASFGRAAYVRRERFKVQRHAAMFMEPRGLVAEWNAAAKLLTVWGAAKMPWHNRSVLARALDMPAESIELIEVDVGGAFGSRGEFYPEDFLIPAAAKILGRPVKWTEDRREHMVSAAHSRDTECDVEIAFDADGHILGLRGDVWVDVGAYIRTNGAVAPRNIAQNMCGPYKVAAIDLRCAMVVTNKTPSGSYRGPGRFETDFIRERLIDIAAREMQVDRIELRRQNLVADTQMPYALPSIAPGNNPTELDSGDYRAVLERCLAEFRWHERAKMRGRLIEGRHHGLAIGCYVEGGGMGPKEAARLALETEGSLSVYLGSSAIGQGLETVMAQIAADAMEMPIEQIRVYHGTTSFVKDGHGSYNSRSTVMGGSSILAAAEKLKSEIVRHAALQLGCSPAEVVLNDGQVRTSRTSLPVTALEGLPIEAEASFSSSKYTWSYGTHAAHVAVDPGTGHVELIDYLSIEDVGRIINPKTLHGQTIGAIVQGLGGTLLEHMVYDADGQLLTGSFADYLLPTMMDFPAIRSVALELKPSPNNPLGAKGAGEGGIIPVGGVIANAVADALISLGVQPTELPLSPPGIWRLIANARAKGANLRS